MAWCMNVASPLIMHWGSHSLAHSHQYDLLAAKYNSIKLWLETPYVFHNNFLVSGSNFQSYIRDRYHEHFLWNCSQVNATRSYWWLINIGSGNGLVLSGNKIHYLDRFLPSSITSYGVTRTQWVMLSLQSFYFHFRYKVTDLTPSFIQAHGILQHSES